MIIELFGPSGAGKTTLAYAVATALKENGCDVQLIESSRPAERPDVRRQPLEGFARYKTRRLADPLSRAIKLVSAVPSVLSGARSNDIEAKLMQLLPPRNLFWSVRYRRYLCLLWRAWNMASASRDIVIFDQGFLSALCSLFLLTRPVDAKLLSLGLELIPRPSHIIRLDVPRPILEARLRERLRRQGALERLFELDLQTTLKQVEIVSELTNLLQERGWPITHVSCLDRYLLKKAVDEVVRAIASSSKSTLQ
jgi:thymidylate kinase